MRNKKGNAIIGLTVALIIGILTLTIAWNLIQEKQTNTAIVDDQFTMSNSSCVQVTSKCLTSFGRVENVSDQSIGADNYSSCGVGLSNGKLNGIIFDNSGGDVDTWYNGETLNATYTEIDCTQITGTTAQIINYPPLLWAVGLLVLVAGFIGVSLWRG